MDFISWDDFCQQTNLKMPFECFKASFLKEIASSLGLKGISFNCGKVFVPADAIEKELISISKAIQIEFKIVIYNRLSQETTLFPKLEGGKDMSLTRVTYYVCGFNSATLDEMKLIFKSTELRVFL